MSTTKEASIQTPTVAPEQLHIPLFRGEPLTSLPNDLYIPPEALQVFLDAFEGPLDLLLYLIKRNNMDIVDIKVADITRQYMNYVELMKSSQFELAAEYLVMAATLTEIKSRMLLPRSEELSDDEEDPRAELIRRLQEYERFKQASENLNNLPRMNRDIFSAIAHGPNLALTKVHPEVDLNDMLIAMANVMSRDDMFKKHNVVKDSLSVRERMSDVLSLLSTERLTPFVTLYNIEEGRAGIVITFMAIMELLKELLIDLVQTKAYGPIHIKARVD